MTKYGFIRCAISSIEGELGLVFPELLPLNNKGDIIQKTESNLGPYEIHDFFFYDFLRRGTSGKKTCFSCQYCI